MLSNVPKLKLSFNALSELGGLYKNLVYIELKTVKIPTLRRYQL
jgi:hypothetical protein